MCKLNKSNKGTRIDPCMRSFINNLKIVLTNTKTKVMACCCGHGKYPMTIVVEHTNNFIEKGKFDLVSGKYIHTSRKFYKKDKQGYYYISETLAVNNKEDGLLNTEVNH